MFGNKVIIRKQFKLEKIRYNMKKRKIPFIYYVVWGLGVIAIGLLIFGIIRALLM